MSETVAEFMQKPVKKYACGKKAQEAKKKLVKAFTASEKSKKVEEKALFKKIVDSVMKTEKGRKTMTALSELGYSFAFETGDFGGLCNAMHKKILINPVVPFDYMLRTAVHEGTHAIQASLKRKDAPEYCDMNVASMLRFRRAIEADAVAHEMAFVYECRDVIPDVYQNTKEQNLPMFTAYVGEMKKSGDEKKAMQASFAAWYECDSYRNAYDKFHKGNIIKWCEQGRTKKEKGLFSENYPVGDVMKLCLYKGQSYMSPEFLNKGLPFSVPAKDKKEISVLLRDYAKAVGEKPDTSIQSMRERRADGTLLPEKKAVKAAVVAKKKQAGR